MIDSKTFQKFANNPASFRESLIVDVDGNSKRFGDCQDLWQRDDFRAIDPGLLRCVGRSNETDVISRVWLERARGHSKSTDLAITAIWSLVFATRIVRGVCFAADRDQAAILKQAMETIIKLNPWIADILTVERNRIVNKAVKHPGNGSFLSVETSDASSSYGLLVDFIICDEVCHWSESGEKLWHSVISTVAKRSNALLVCITNSGFADSWQWNVRETVRTDPAWYFSRLDGPQASWITPIRLEEQRRMLPAIAFARLWLNSWSTGGGDCFQEVDIRAAFDETMRPMDHKDERWLYVSGVDLSVSRDFSAVLTLAIPNRRYDRVRLADHRIWKPLGKKIDLSEVEAYLLDLDSRFGLEQIAVDPFQGELLMTRLENSSQHRRRNQQRRHWAKPWCHVVPPTGANLRESASLLIEYVTDHRLSLYSCEPLRRDMLKARCEEKSYGFRITSPRDSEGHGDALSAFQLALFVGHELAGIRPTVAGVGNVQQSSPMQHALAELDRERIADEDEREMFRQYDQSGLSNCSHDLGFALWQSGRIR